MEFVGRNMNPHVRRQSKNHPAQGPSLKTLWYLLLCIPLVFTLVLILEVGSLENFETSTRTVGFKGTRLRKKPETRTTMVMIANYRDSQRCAETLVSLFDNAVEPDLLSFGIHDQIYLNGTDRHCVEVYCDMVGLTEEGTCKRRDQIQTSSVDAQDAKGPTVGRYHTEKFIQNQDFCMSIDSHLLFIPKWDREVKHQFDSLQNPRAIITVYPKSTEFFNSTTNNSTVNKMCNSEIESTEIDAMIKFSAMEQQYPPDKPILQSQIAGGFNFGDCIQAKTIRNDPYTPFLFHGEEYSRAARLWTSGYDMYAPCKDICFHWYEPRKVVWERDWGTRFYIQQRSRRRVRQMLGLSISQQDVDMTEMDQFSLGTQRTMAQWKRFSGIDPTAAFDPTTSTQFNNCGPLELVPLLTLDS